MEKRNVDGLEFGYDPSALDDWATFDLVLSITNDKLDKMGQFNAAMGLIYAMTDLTKERIVEHCGGHDAKTADVLTLMLAIVTDIAQKN